MHHHHLHHSSPASSSAPNKDCIPSSSQQEHCSTHCNHVHKLIDPAEVCNIDKFQRAIINGRAERLQAYLASKYSEKLAFGLSSTPKQIISMKASQDVRLLDTIPCVHSQAELMRQSNKQLERILKLERPLSEAKKIKRDAKLLEDLIDTFKAKGYSNSTANAKAIKYIKDAFGGM
jgi:hypothetical protein